jgi:hypothetical protein
MADVLEQKQNHARRQITQRHTQKCFVLPAGIGFKKRGFKTEPLYQKQKVLFHNILSSHNLI